MRLPGKVELASFQEQDQNQENTDLFILTIQDKKDDIVLRVFYMNRRRCLIFPKSKHLGGVW